MATIEVRGLTRSFPLRARARWSPRGTSGARKINALGPLDLDVRDGELVALLGPSGCGKSTMLHLLAGLDAPTTGTLLVNGQSPAELQARHQLGIAFQEHALLPWRSVEGNLRLPFEIAGLAAGERSTAERSTAERSTAERSTAERSRAERSTADRIQDLIALVGLTGFEHARPAELSGGMRQRVSIARALALSPKLLLLDEPFGALDAVTRRRMNVELERIWLQSRPTTVMVTHTVEEAILLADRIVVFTSRPGRVQMDRMIPFARPRSLALTRTAEFHAIADELTSSLEPASRTELR